jgi:hypothetical protein
MRCFRGESGSDVMALLGTRNEPSTSWDELVYRRSRVERFGINTSEFSSSEDAAYRTELAAFLGLERVARAAPGGINMFVSFGLGLRRRAMSARRRGGRDNRKCSSESARNWSKKNTRPSGILRCRCVSGCFFVVAEVMRSRVDKIDAKRNR